MLGEYIYIDFVSLGYNSWFVRWVIVLFDDILEFDYVLEILCIKMEKYNNKIIVLLL